jgi:hypothetical protein
LERGLKVRRWTACSTRGQNRRFLLWDAAAEAVGKVGDAAAISFGPPTHPAGKRLSSATSTALSLPGEQGG